jgi:hypothetical protein
MDVFRKRRGKTQTLSENIVYIMNRIQDEETKKRLLDFLYYVSSDPEFNDFFFVNDARVLLDVLAREIEREDDAEMLRLQLSILDNIMHQYPLLKEDRVKLSHLLVILQRMSREGTWKEALGKCISTVQEALETVHSR